MFLNKNEAFKKLSAYDATTAGHCKRVANYVYNWAIFLGSKIAEELYWGALLHDVGKLLVNVEIINSPNRLTEAEFVQIKRHTSAEVKNLIADLGLTKVQRNQVLGHHCGLGNTGYGSYEGEELPFECRITMICDIYDALHAERSYKKGFETSKCLEIMHEDNKIDQELLASFVDFIESEAATEKIAA